MLYCNATHIANTTYRTTAGKNWDGILAESKLVAEGCGVVPTLKLTDTKRKRKRLLPDKTVLDDDFS